MTKPDQSILFSDSAHVLGGQLQSKARDMNNIRKRVSVDNGHRKGAVIVLAAAMLIVVFGFAAFTVDFGMIALTKGQIQNAADSAAHAAVLEVSRSFGPGGELTQDQAEDAARARAVEMVGLFRSGDQPITAADETRDVRLGRRSWNEQSLSWDEDWGVTPYCQWALKTGHECAC